MSKKFKGYDKQTVNLIKQQVARHQSKARLLAMKNYNKQLIQKHYQSKRGKASQDAFDKFHANYKSKRISNHYSGTEEASRPARPVQRHPVPRRVDEATFVSEFEAFVKKNYPDELALQDCLRQMPLNWIREGRLPAFEDFFFDERTSRLVVKVLKEFLHPVAPVSGAARRPGVISSADLARLKYKAGVIDRKILAARFAGRELPGVEDFVCNGYQFHIDVHSGPDMAQRYAAMFEDRSSDLWEFVVAVAAMLERSGVSTGSMTTVWVDLLSWTAEVKAAGYSLGELKAGVAAPGTLTEVKLDVPEEGKEHSG